jgi:hypothetical protein
MFYYKTPDGTLVQVDITPEGQVSGYSLPPSALQALTEISSPAGHLY